MLPIFISLAVQNYYNCNCEEMHREIKLKENRYNRASSLLSLRREIYMKKPNDFSEKNFYKEIDNFTRIHERLENLIQKYIDCGCER